MHLIIDGYNLLGALGRVHGSKGQHSEMARESLLQDLTAYRHRKGHPMTVVFDGWRQGHPVEHREHRAGVQIIYSRRGETADQVIQRLAREYGADCAIVSSDHEIVNAARSQGAFVLGAREFAGKLRGVAFSSGAVPHKELDTGEEACERPRQGKKGNPRKLPKSRRQRDRRLSQF
jgi:predicted RNA-binding protein with PIN domain